MARKARELTTIEVRRLTRRGHHPVGGVPGLLLRVSETGAQSWILRTTVGVKRRDYGLGGFPEVGLAAARDRAREYRALIREGRDPAAERQAARAALEAEQARRITFAEAARRCHAARVDGFRNRKHRKDWISSLERYVFPAFGRRPVAEVSVADVVNVLTPVWTTRTETATRVRQRIEAVLDWATVSGYREGTNPAKWRGGLDHLLPKASKVARVEHYPALPWRDVPAFVVELRTRAGMGARALEFAILTAARSGEVRLATWDEVDLEERLWTVPASRIKAGKRHKVPLAEDAVVLLEALPRFEGVDFVFPAPRNGPLSDMALTQLLRRMDVPAVAHGFRSSFKDWARSATAYPDEVSELALAHVSTDATRAAYARDELIAQRRRLMADWARFLREGMPEGEVVPLRGRVQA